ncbi:helix-turn-helix domain-containing protein [Nocardiopsis sp. CT-R113]|uniref:Helix-turn-helix domain-containing protein n=1 Tax=Nocardiopsis codii TaxID=3065942 RepID=A0ABU7K082_9ACTN|nr:helix-turn-helix domain-containing protein [Nocardiopsis sp. CT-R113]MEE2035670.1 helix-turn-helix domain-containing protein [Nocardiopsis sp. CT-R113]
MAPSTGPHPGPSTAPSSPAAEAAATERELRSDRILDAAEELLVAWGRRKITIEDVARRAKVGKGTVYLHFATKEALLLTVVMRAQLGLMRQVLDFMGRSPDNVRPSEVARSVYLSHLDSPLMRAVFTGGTESLGNLSRDAAALVGEIVVERQRSMEAYWGVLRDLGLLRSDLPADNQLYAYNALVLAHLVTPPVLEQQGLHVPDHDERADLMARSIRLLLEQDTAPEDTRKAQTRALEILSALYRSMRSEIERLQQSPRTA